MTNVSPQVTQEALQNSYREVQLLQRQKDNLQKQLGDIASKINSGMIPDLEDLELPDAQPQGLLLSFSVEELHSLDCR